MSYLELLLSQLVKGTPIAVGWHEHPDYPSGSHLIEQHHRKNPHSYTVPEEYWKDPRYSEEEDPGQVQTHINLTDIARQYNVSSKSLGRALRREVYISPEQLQLVEHYDAEGRPMKIQEILLTPPQVQYAHRVARAVRQKSLNRSRPVGAKMP